MGYVAVKGGVEAISASIERLQYERIKDGISLDVKAIEVSMRGLIDQIMSESSLYSSELAALAIKQAEGSMEEAVFLLRAYRSTLPRKHYTQVADTEEMQIERRISASFKDIPGGQILGASYDYTHRLLDFNLLKEDEAGIKTWVSQFEENIKKLVTSITPVKLPKVAAYLRDNQLMQDCKENNEEPTDITKENLEFPSNRSSRLQILTRGQTGAVTSLGYAALRAYGDLHPTVGELRVGELPLYVGESQNEEDREEDYYIGNVQITEVESFIPKTVEQPSGKKEVSLEMGYGICYGQNETKAIAMSILDQCLETGDPRYPTHDEEFVLMHIDAVESTGFISHLKLPHYVTFQSKLDSIRKTKKGEDTYGNNL